MLELPMLPDCPYHSLTPPASGLASCHICWNKFYIPFEYEKELQRINSVIKDYLSKVDTAQMCIALQKEGFETRIRPPKDTALIFALPNGDRIEGMEIDDLMGGTYPVKLDGESPIQYYLGWKLRD
jgi:hypothetical protein